MFRTAILSITLAMAAPVAVLAGEPSIDARVAAQIHRLEAVLDPVSAGVLRGNQQAWDAWAKVLDARAAEMVERGEGSAQDLAEARASVREQRLNFLAGIKPAAPDDLKGGWSNGMTEILFDMDGRGHAKLVSISHDLVGKQVLCVVDGGVKVDRDGFVITPGNAPDGPVHVRRLGIALSIEETETRPGGTAPYCQPGATLAGHYFHIEGAEKVMPWLLN